MKENERCWMVESRRWRVEGGWWIVKEDGGGWMVEGGNG